MSDYDDIRSATAKAEADDAAEDTAYQAQIDALKTSQARLQAEFDAYKAKYPATTPPPTPTPPPPTTTSAALGVYTSPGISADASVTAAFGPTQMRASYYQPTQAVNIAGETARIKNKQSPLITLTLKTGTVTLNDVANQTTAGLAKIDAYIASLKTLSEIDRNVPVYATLDHELEVKINQGTITGVTLAQYAKALSVFISRCTANAPLVRTLYWFGGSDQAKITQVLAGLTAAPWGIGYDPYVTSGESASATFTDNAKTVLTWLRANVDYKRLGSPPIGLSEFGMATAHGDTAVAKFLTGIKPQMATLGLVFANYFNSTGTVGTLITDGSHPQAVAALKASAAA